MGIFLQSWPRLCNKYHQKKATCNLVKKWKLELIPIMNHIKEGSIKSKLRKSNMGISRNMIWDLRTKNSTYLLLLKYTPTYVRHLQHKFTFPSDCYVYFFFSLWFLFNATYKYFYFRHIVIKYLLCFAKLALKKVCISM